MFIDTGTTRRRRAHVEGTRRSRRRRQDGAVSKCFGRDAGAEAIVIGLVKPARVDRADHRRFPGMETRSPWPRHRPGSVAVSTGRRRGGSRARPPLDGVAARDCRAGRRRRILRRAARRHRRPTRAAERELTRALQRHSAWTDAEDGARSPRQDPRFALALALSA